MMRRHGETTVHHFFASCPGLVKVCMDEVRVRFGSALISISSVSENRVEFTVKQDTSIDVRSCRSLDKIYFQIGVVLAPSLLEMQSNFANLAVNEKIQQFTKLYLTKNEENTSDETINPSFKCFSSREKDCIVPYTSRDASGYIGEAFAAGTGWSVSLKEYQCEVFTRIALRCLSDFDNDSGNDENVTALVGILVPQSKPGERGVKHFSAMTLRQSIAYLMTHLASIETGDVVLDPMLGGGSLLFQARDTSNGIAAIGGDVYPGILTVASHNMMDIDNSRKQTLQKSESARNGSAGTWDILNMDAGRIPLRTGIVDVVICDLPFGKRCMTKAMLKELYPRAVNEMARLLRAGTGRAVLMTAEGGLLRCAIEAYREFWEISEEKIPCYMLHHGGKWVSVFRIQRSHKPFCYSKMRSLRIVGPRCYRCGAVDHVDTRICQSERISDQEFGLIYFRPKRYTNDAAIQSQLNKDLLRTNIE